jgi:uncharacterized membrane protein
VTVSTYYNRIAGTGLYRLAALSDGLFAIAMTLIILEVHVPPRSGIQTEADLGNALIALAPRMSTYLLSFLTLGIFWVGQQTQLNHFARTNRQLTWLNLGFLAIVAIMPFSTGILAEFTTLRTALLVYWVNLLLLGIALYVTWRYARYAGLVSPDAPAGVDRAIRRRIVTAQTLYAFGAALCFIHPYWSIGFIVLVQLNYAVAPHIRGRVRRAA